MTVLVARWIAIAVSLGTFVFLFVTDSWRADNLFLVPDLVLCALLVVAAALPTARAIPALVFAFGLTAGVLGTAVAWYAVAGRLGAASLIGTVAVTVMAVLLVRARPWAPR